MRMLNIRMKLRKNVTMQAGTEYKRRNERDDEGCARALRSPTATIVLPQGLPGNLWRIHQCYFSAVYCQLPLREDARTTIPVAVVAGKPSHVHL